MLPAGVSPVAVGVAEATTPVSPSAPELCERIQVAVAQLGAAPERSPLTTLVLGILTTSTLGVAPIAYRIIAIYRASGATSTRTLQVIEESSLKAKSAYGSDPGVLQVLAQAKAAVELHEAKARASRKRYCIGVGIGLGAVIAVAAVFYAIKIHLHQAEVKAAAGAAAQLRQGSVAEAEVRFQSIPAAHRANFVDDDATLQILVDLDKGDDATALAHCSKIDSQVGRERARTYIAGRIVEGNLTKANWPDALAASRSIQPASEQTAAVDRILERQATAAIAANQLDSANRVIENITDPEAKARLRAAEQAKLPPTDSGKF